MPTLSFSSSVGVKHDSHESSHGFGRKVLLEMHSDQSIGSVTSHNSSPDGSVFGVVLEG